MNFEDSRDLAAGHVGNYRDGVVVLCMHRNEMAKRAILVYSNYILGNQLI